MTKVKQGAVQDIETTAMEYQKLTRELKTLKAKIEPMEATLKQYAKEHRELLNEDQQLRYGCGSMVYLTLKPIIEGEEIAKELLIENLDEPFVKLALQEKLIADACKVDDKLLRQITAAGLQIVQKETWNIKAN